MNILQQGLIKYQNDKSKVILYTDVYNVIFTQGPEFLLDKFQTFKPARIIFSADNICWPDENLQVN